MVMKVVRGFTNYGDGTKVRCHRVLWLSGSTSVCVHCFYHIVVS